MKTLICVALVAIHALTSCTSSKTPYVSDAREPNDLPPSPRYTVVLMALQRDLPEFTLRHASETYTAPVKDWPGIVWSHRRSDDALATRVTIDIDAATDDTITTTLSIGHQAPNLRQIRHTSRVLDDLRSLTLLVDAPS